MWNVLDINVELKVSDLKLSSYRRKFSCLKQILLVCFLLLNVNTFFLDFSFIVFLFMAAITSRLRTQGPEPDHWLSSLPLDRLFIISVTLLQYLKNGDNDTDGVLPSWSLSFYFQRGATLFPDQTYWFFPCWFWCFIFVRKITFSLTICVCMCARSLQLCLPSCDPMDCSLPSSSAHGIL